MGGKSLKRDVARVVTRVVDRVQAEEDWRTENSAVSKLYTLADELAPVLAEHAAERTALVARLAAAERWIDKLAWTISSEFSVSGPDEMRQNPRLAANQREVTGARKFLRKGLRPKKKRRR